jgi:hypothetical protein
LCERHKRIKRRHGHPEQQGITVAFLSPYRQRVKARMVKNADNPAWGILRQRWERVLGMTQGKGQSPTARHHREAMSELDKLGKDVDAAVICEVALAMYLLQDDQPRRFKSDTAFDFQLVRRVRGLTDANAGEYWDQKKQRTKRVYRDLPPRTVLTLADYFKATFGVAGLYVARLEQEEMDRELMDKVSLQDALESLK